MRGARALGEARRELVVAPASPAHANYQYVLAAAATNADFDPSPLAAIGKGFDAFLAKRGLYRSKASCRVGCQLPFSRNTRLQLRVSDAERNSSAPGHAMGTWVARCQIEC